MPPRTGLLLVTAVTACATAMTGCSSPAVESTWTFAGTPVTGVEESLASMESAWRGSLANAGTEANVPLDAQCYLQVDDAQEISGQVLCGPVRLAGDPTTTFQSHALAMDTGGARTANSANTASTDGGAPSESGSVRLVLSPDPSSTAIRFQPNATPDPETRAQRRPYGATAPLNAALDEPTVAAVGAVSPTLPELLKGRTITARTPAGPVTFVAARTKSPVDPGFGTDTREVPPDGGSLLVVSAVGLGLGSATATGTATALSTTSTAKATANTTAVDAVVTVDGRTTVLRPDQVTTGAVVPVAAGARSVSVGVRYAGATQSFDAASGRRLTTAGASYYDGLASSARTRCAGVEPGPASSTAVWRQSFSCDLTLIRTSYLPPAPAGGGPQVGGWAADGKTFVVLVVTPNERTGWARPGSAAVTYDPSYFSFGTRLIVGGVGYDPRQLSVEQASGDRAAKITAVFEVPAGQSRVDVRGFVSTRLESPSGADPSVRAGAPGEGNFTYPIDSRATFLTTTG